MKLYRSSRILGSRSFIKASFALGLTLAVSTTWAQNIDTTAVWNGTEYVFPFGLPNTATYGQTITAPATASVLQGFSFQINSQGVAFPFQAYVYAWDAANSHATGPALYTSPVITTTGDNAFHAYSFAVPSMSLTPGTQYVLFASVTNTPGGSG